jgi:hypothetical protein
LDVTIPNTLNQGIYIVKIATSEGHITKKLFLK